MRSNIICSFAAIFAAFTQFAAVFVAFTLGERSIPGAGRSAPRFFSLICAYLSR
jgi:hypothetical protein